ncbi:MAG: 50S ribosomal protein L31 [Myxococcales bacterium]|nr:50S ribosomal protein L31 [Myxococcales bacterium]
MPKQGIHPAYIMTKVNCACGNIVVTASTRGSFAVDICSACHPFYTGKQKLMDTAGRIDRFQRKYGRSPAAPKPE